MKVTKFQLLPATRANRMIAEIQALAIDDRIAAVFAMTKDVLWKGGSARGADVATMMFKASIAPKAERQAILDKHWALLEKARDNDVKVVNMVRTRFNLSKYLLDPAAVAVHSFKSDEVRGDQVTVGAHTQAEFVQRLIENPEHRKMLVNWGRGLVHKDTSAAAAELASPTLLLAKKTSILRLAQYAKEVVPFATGSGATWSVEAYQAVIDSRAGVAVKPGKVMRGVKDLIIEGISAAWFARSFAEFPYESAFIIEGKQKAMGLLYPREARTRDDVRELKVETRKDANWGQEEYAGGESILLRHAQDKVVQMPDGLNIDGDDVRDAVGDARQSFLDYAAELEDNARAMHAVFEGELSIKEGDVEFTDFDQLKEALATRLESRRKVREEARNTDALHMHAMSVLDVAMGMDAVNRRTYVKGFEAEGAAFTDALRWAVAFQKKRKELAALEAAELAKEAAKEAAYAATAARAEAWAADKDARAALAAKHALAGAALSAEMAAIREKEAV